jgi:HlyD family secretion protein
MAKLSWRNPRIWILVGVVVAVGGFLGFRYWKAKQSALPEGIASGNGRLEAKLVDVSAKEPLRVKDVLVTEGDLVQPGQVVAHLDVSTLESQLAEAKAQVAAAQEQMAVSQAAIVRQQSEIGLAKIEAQRASALVAERAGSQRESDVRNTALQTSQASLVEEQAKLQAAKQDVEAARAQVATIQSRINDATLVSPVVGRVLYRLAEPGEVLAAGGKALTLVDLSDVYMEIYLPSDQAAALKLGSDARVTVDYAPDRAAAAHVTFVSPEAQFTPKEVETKSEREKLMFRVKLQVPRELVLQYVDQIKTGVRGVGYVKVDPSASWPARLQQGLVRTTVGGEVKPTASDTSKANGKPGP